jgi:hypothetical protein
MTGRLGSRRSLHLGDFRSCISVDTVIPEDPQQEQVQEIRQELLAMPVDLREAVGRWLLERRNARLRAQREEIEAHVRTLMPAEPSDPDD